MTDEARTELKGTILRLKDLIGYQDGSISSRMILSRPVGNITLFSFDRNESLSEHTAPYDAVVTILEGECEIRLSGETFAVKEGDTMIFPAGAPHAVTAVTRFKMMLTMIRE
jgi:quercetin dioxygenase-like cupin family protein